MSDEPVLDVQNIQGNILAGFNKDFQILVGLAIIDVGAAKAWLKAISPNISSTYEVLHFNRAFRAVRKKTSREPFGLIATWFNIAFSRQGIEMLSSAAEAASLPDAAFQTGMPARSVSILGDPSDPASPSNYRNWKIGGPGNIPDVLLIVASDEPQLAATYVEDILAADKAGGLKVIYRETGLVRKDMPGHEHFGFKDGISQPGVRGRASSREDDFITDRSIARTDPLAATFAKPGQPLIMSGQFLLGYATQDPISGRPQPPAQLAFDWYRNGTFLIFRRLRQDVIAFRQFTQTTASALAQKVPGITSDVLAATFVGRWPDGTPMIRSPTAPDAAMTTSTAANAFEFTNPMGNVRLKPGAQPDAKPPAPGDPLGQVCPHWAHIRKVNPRDDVTDLGDENDTLTRRLLRRGIPYGPPLGADAFIDDGIDRGLLFLAYHASIVQSFEKITSDWINQVMNPNPRGHDPVIGQTNQGGRTRIVSYPASTGPIDISLTREWVFPTGGGYYFVPSLSAIASVLSSDTTKIQVGPPSS